MDVLKACMGMPLAAAAIVLDARTFFHG